MSFSDIELWCFSFVTLFNLQGTRRRLGGGTFFILPHFFELVKYFFQSFFSTLLAPLSASESFVILSHQLSFVKCFFQLFQSFFSPRLASSLFLSKAWLSYHIRFRLSSAFFRFFWTFSLGPPEPRPPLGQLAYYTKSFTLCQYLSGKNWKFLEICRFLSVPAGLRAHFTWFFAGIGIYTADFSYILLL